MEKFSEKNQMLENFCANVLKEQRGVDVDFKFNLKCFRNQ